mmetsp:Transcript_103078/g.298143  ORF Transcript_103078/g.298143 Transcript_103078/m.298143 type:complete len:336 (+) Transcript_103078:127-1134(+)
MHCHPQPVLAAGVHVARGRYLLEAKLGEGSFGMVFRGTDTRYNYTVAIKFEDLRGDAAGQLKNEARLLNHLHGRQGFTEVHHFGKEDHWALLVMDLLGKNLEHCAENCGGKLNHRSVCLVAQQAIQLLEYVHSKGVVHRDIKTENFAWGLGRQAHHLHLIDFGMSTMYYLRGRKHCRMLTGNDLTGTARYASINAMRGLTQSRRDDLEAVGHMLFYLLRGSLPWSGLDARTYEEKLRKICRVKQTFPIKDLRSGHPIEYEEFLGYCRSLAFDQRPDYKRWLDKFQVWGRQQQPPLHEYSLEWLEGDQDRVRGLLPHAPYKPCKQPDDHLAPRDRE